ncbi:D-ribose ABC transporter substrate-binding protein [Alicyclobacillus shizuokensis]|uniref:D-ribose ABC transporter substrate-binding protein n=1 Tax=Alicyclobacillus shizuokensis TaxID=392014 RepID=UPI00083135C6|nr:D-ribose ABC transporter substrate-binding protein [Alicyclobacillus shizuokensis]
MRKKSVVVASALTIGLLAGCGVTGGSPNTVSGNTSSSSSSASGSGKTIGFAVSTLNNPFFVAMQKGAKEEAQKEGVKLIVDNGNNDSSTQLNQVEDLIQQKVDAIILNPVDSQGLAQAVKMANNANIPVITLDRTVTGAKVTTYIASDNVKAGKMAADELIKALGGKGSVVELQGQIGTSSEREREQGFDQEIKKASGIQVVARQAANFDRNEALNVMQNLLQAYPTVKGVFAQNDEMALGALKAIEQSGKSGIRIVGIDGEAEAVNDVNKGLLYADIAQQPEREGQLGVEYAIKAANGENVDAIVSSPIKLIEKGSSFKGF